MDIDFWGIRTKRTAAGIELDVQTESVFGIRSVNSRVTDQIAVRVGRAEDWNRRRMNVRELARDPVEFQEGSVGKVKQFVNVLADFSALRMRQYSDVCVSFGGRVVCKALRARPYES